MLYESGLTYTHMPKLEFGASDAQDHGRAPRLHVLGGALGWAIPRKDSCKGPLAHSCPPGVCAQFFPQV